MKPLKHTALAVGLGLVMASLTAPAALLSFQDDDIDYFLRADSTAPGGYAAVTSGPIQIGDIALSVFEFPTVTVDGVDIVGPNEEFTGIAGVKLVDIVNPDSTHPADGSGATVGSVYIFDVWTDFNSFVVSQGGGDLGSVATDAVVAVWRNSTTDFDLDLDRAHNGGNPNCASLSQCISEAATGTLFQVDGFLGDGDESWTAIQLVAGGGDLASVKAANNTVPVASVNFFLSNIYQAIYSKVDGINVGSGLPCNFTGVNPIADGCAQVTGNVNLTGGQGISASNPAVAHSTTINAQKYVPEPATLALFGIGLLGLGARARREV